MLDVSDRWPGPPSSLGAFGCGGTCGRLENMVSRDILSLTVLRYRFKGPKMLKFDSSYASSPCLTEKRQALGA